MGNRNIEPGSVLHGILHSDFDNFLLYRYNELLKVFEDVFKGKGVTQNRKFADFFINQLNNNIADNERVINDLKINIENEVVQKGFVSLSRIKLNNIQTIVAKTKCLITDLKMMSDNMTDIPKERKPYDSIYRVRAFYMVMMQRSGRITKEDFESRDKFIEIASREFSGEVKTTHRQIYNMSRSAGINLQFLDKKIKDFEADYNYGQYLYKMKYPDT